MKADFHESGMALPNEFLESVDVISATTASAELMNRVQ